MAALKKILRLRVGKVVQQLQWILALIQRQRWRPGGAFEKHAQRRRDNYRLLPGRHSQDF